MRNTKVTCTRLMFQYLSVGHPTYYKGLDYIYEDRGEVNKYDKLMYKHLYDMRTLIGNVKLVFLGSGYASI